MGRMEANLHLHLDGSLSMDVVRTLAEKTGYDLEEKDLKKLLCVGDDCVSLARYLSCFDLPGILLQTEDALKPASCDLVKCPVAQGLVYTEIRFAPQLHRQKGLTQEQAMEAVVRRVRVSSQEGGMYAGVLLCAMVSGNGGDSEETLELSRVYLGKGVVDADIAGPEELVLMKHFEGMSRRTCQVDIPFTIHAGEHGDYENVALTVSYGVRRIGYGYAAIHSEAHMDLLRQENITLGMCVVSSLQTKAAGSVKAHPLKEFYARGIKVIYSTDDMMASDTDLKREATLIIGQVGLTQEDLIQMNKTAVEAGFTGAEVREGTLRRMREQSGIWKQEKDNLDECLDKSLKECRAW